MIPKMGTPKINLENVTNLQSRKSVHQLTTFHHQITTTSPQITAPKHTKFRKTLAKTRICHRQKNLSKHCRTEETK
jgi:hypothetical protein